eukprot:TRINITY_DN25076_c0_g2_i1.p1 TRINITY_DN25076_c0_g2~~TRINITY_DN25076_c0_g2_i1.p1  ORF type:complete len:756 (+),score=251.86 TRINITY_DN25076_c0_g2_i1:125-2392(+)
MAVPMQQVLLVVAVLFCGSDATAGPKGTAALEKVVEMLNVLHKKSEDELHQETITYTKFESFCQDTKEEKENAIKAGETYKKTFEAAILEKGARSAMLGEEIEGLITDINSTEEAISNLDSTRRSEKATYEADKHELASAIQGLSQAISGLKAKPDDFKTISFLQRPEVRKATALAKFLGLKSDAAERVMAMQEESPKKDKSPEPSLALSQRHQVPYQYSFDVSRGLKETLEKMLDDFRDARNTMDLDEMKAHSTYSKTKQAKMQLLAQHERNKQTAQNNKDAASKAKAQAERSLSVTERALADDNAYLEDTLQMCADKKDAWDLRKKARKDEIEAIKAALNVMNNEFDKPEVEKAAMVQSSMGSDTSGLSALEEAEAAAESAEATSSKVPESPVVTRKAGFLQMRKAAKLVNREHKLRSPRQDLVAMLRSKSVELQSPMFLALAKSAKETKAEDPLATVKAMMEDLIQDKEKEAGQASDHKEFCDEKVPRAEGRRDKASAEVSKLNTAMAAGEASRDQLSLDITRLDKELKELADAKAEAERLRSEEKAENDAAVKEAGSGFEAVSQALVALKDFYDNAKGEDTESVTPDAQGMPPKQNVTGASKDAIDVGYDDSKKYAGAGESNTVMGMLEVVKSDFNRTLVDTKVGEAAAEADHRAFLEKTSTSVTEKEGTRQEKSSQKGSVEEQLEQDETAMKAQAASLQAALDELAQLAKQCSYISNSETRIAKRAKEIKALEDAVEYVTKLMRDLQEGR